MLMAKCCTSYSGPLLECEAREGLPAAREQATLTATLMHSCMDHFPWMQICKKPGTSRFVSLQYFIIPFYLHCMIALFYSNPVVLACIYLCLFSVQLILQLDARMTTRLFTSFFSTTGHGPSPYCHPHLWYSEPLYRFTVLNDTCGYNMEHCPNFCFVLCHSDWKVFCVCLQEIQILNLRWGSHLIFISTISHGIGIVVKVA